MIDPVLKLILSLGVTYARHILSSVPSCFQHGGDGPVQFSIQGLQGGGTSLQLSDRNARVRGLGNPIYHYLRVNPRRGQYNCHDHLSSPRPERDY